ncbi:hypothetical protein [Streptomyces fructofermentans]|uniref:hypothetical protein n=1 Tax=Streptomyces fructofermentans TaxID=152141 RepID=UPI0033F1E3AF
MRVYDTERQEWGGSRRERLFHTDQYLDVPRQKAVRQRTGIVLAVVGLAFGVWALAWKDEPEPYREPAAAEQESTAGTDGAGNGVPPTGSGTPDAASTALPVGYASQQDAEGYRIALPEDWTREARSSQYGIDVVDYRSPDGTRRLQVFQVLETSPYASLKAARVEAEKLDGYEAVSLAEVPADTGSAAEHEYRADEIAGEQDGGSTRHVIDHRFEAADGERYALVAYGSDADGAEDERELVDTALLWFCPPGLECDPPAG